MEESYNDKLFFKIWRNIVILNKILKFNQNVIEISDWRIKEFRNLKDYEESKNNYLIKSIIMIHCFDKPEQFLEFFEELPSNIDSVEIRNYEKLTIDIKTFKTPPTLKTLKFDHSTGLREFESHKDDYDDGYTITSTSNINDISHLSNQISGIKKLYLGFRSEELVSSCYLPDTVKQLILSCVFYIGISENNLPKGLKSLVILNEYIHNYLVFPDGLEHFSYAKSNMLDINIIQNYLPSSITSLRLDCSLKGKLTKDLLLSNQLSNLKKLSISWSNFEALFDVSKGKFESLTSLDIVKKGFFQIGSLNILLLPQSLKKLKIWNLSLSFKNGIVPSKKLFPGSLKTIVATLPSLSYLKYANRDKIENIGIILKDSRPSLSELKSSMLDFDENLKNIKSIKYYGCESLSYIVLPTTKESIEKLNNLEIELTSSFENTSTIEIIDFSKLESLKSMKLNSGFSVLLFDSTIKPIYPHPKTVPSMLFPLSLVFLEISILNINFVLSIETLPKSIKYLKINGFLHKPTFHFPLPETLQEIFISNLNPLFKDSLLLEKLSNSSVTITPFYQENDKKFYSKPTYSKLYNKIRKLLI